MSAKVMKAVVVFSVLIATICVGESDSPHDILGTYKLVSVNDNPLPAVSWVGPGEGCTQENLSGTMLIASDNRWAALLEGRDKCDKTSEEGSAILTGTYKVSGNMIEFQGGELDVTDHASLDGDVLRYTVNGILDFEGQTTEFVFRKDK